MDEKDIQILKLRKEKAEILMAFLQMQFQQCKRELELEIMPALKLAENGDGRTT